MFSKGFKTFAACGLLALGLALFGCAGDGDSSGSTNGTSAGGRGTLNVRLADAPDPTISSLVINVTKVEANIDGGWQTLDVQDTEVDLLDLVKNDILLATNDVPAGHYNQVRVFVDSATVTDGDGTHNVTIPSGAQTGIKLNVNGDIEPNQIVTLLLDFNVGKSLIKTGNGQYKLQPVIPVVVKVLSGTISGTVRSSSGELADNTDVQAIYTSGGSYPVGTEVNTSYTLDDGTFKLWALLPGTYTLHFTRTDGEASETATIEDVTVTANHDTDIGLVTLD
jgi:hypothetical protein